MTFFSGEPHERNCYRTDRPCDLCETDDPVVAMCHAMGYFLNAIVFIEHCVWSHRRNLELVARDSSLQRDIEPCAHDVPRGCCTEHWDWPKHPVAYYRVAVRP